jgi:hypothetical protein
LAASQEGLSSMSGLSHDTVSNSEYTGSICRLKYRKFSIALYGYETDLVRKKEGRQSEELI